MTIKQGCGAQTVMVAALAQDTTTTVPVGGAHVVVAHIAVRLVALIGYRDYIAMVTSPAHTDRSASLSRQLLQLPTTTLPHSQKLTNH